MEATRGGQKRMTDTLKPELASVLVMGSELGSPARAVRDFNH